MELILFPRYTHLLNIFRVDVYPLNLKQFDSLGTTIVHSVLFNPVFFSY
jgi:hypothetical protein